MAAQVFTPKYITYEDLQIYLKNKVEIGAGTNQFSTDEINTFAATAERLVESDLKKIYLVPFQNEDGGDFASLPEDTRANLVGLCIWKSLVYILSLAFGANSAVISQNYYMEAVRMYNSMRNQITDKDKTTGLYRNPFLTGMALNPRTYTGQISAPLPRVIDPLAGINNTKQAISRLTNNTKNFGYLSLCPIVVNKGNG